MILELKSYLHQDIKSKCEILLFIKSRRHKVKSLLAPLLIFTVCIYFQLILTYHCLTMFFFPASMVLIRATRRLAGEMGEYHFLNFFGGRLLAVKEKNKHILDLFPLPSFWSPLTFHQKICFAKVWISLTHVYQPTLVSNLVLPEMLKTSGRVYLWLFLIKKGACYAGNHAIRKWCYS